MGRHQCIAAENDANDVDGSGANDVDEAYLANDAVADTTGVVIVTDAMGCRNSYSY